MMPIRDTMQRRITNIAFGIGVASAGIGFALVMFMAVGGFE